MALVRVAQYGSVPGPVTDYQAQNAHLQAFTNQLLTQQFILDSGTAQPVIKQGCYVSHGGSLYVADADTAITGSPSDGSVYIRVSGTTTLTVEFINNISGYTWNPVYSALTSGSYTLLPYLIVKAGTVWTRYNFNPNNQQFGSLASLAVTGNITVGGTVDGHDIDSELDTLNGRVNQAVNTTSSPTFANIHAKVNDAEFYTGGAKKATVIDTGSITGSAFCDLLLPYLPNIGDVILVSGRLVKASDNTIVLLTNIQRGSNGLSFRGIDTSSFTGYVLPLYYNDDTNLFAGTIVL